MPAIVKGTVVLWELDETDPNKPRVLFERAKDVIVYTPGNPEDIQAPAFISQYIKDGGISDAAAKKIWEDAGKGLVKAFETDRTSVTPPPVPEQTS